MELYQEKEWRDVSLVKEVSKWVWTMEGAVSGEGVVKEVSDCVWRELYQEKEWRDVLLVKEVSE